MPASECEHAAVIARLAADIRIANLCCITSSSSRREPATRFWSITRTKFGVSFSAVRVLLISMPDSFEHTPTIAIRMPNGALASLAGNIDAHHDVAIADLVLAQSAVRQTVEQLVRGKAPDIVGLSVMTFQRTTARRLIALIRSITPEVFIVVGGYDPSLAPEAWTHPALGVDAVVRGEGELTFRALLRALEQGRPLSEVDGLWFRESDGFRQTPSRPITAV